MDLNQSYRYCERIARSRAKNFYFSFIFLPKKKRKAISAIYAFMRVCDDIADDFLPTEAKKARLQEWRNKVRRLLTHHEESHPIFPALRDTLQQFKIPEKYLMELLDGVEMDLNPNTFHTFEELYSYCYKVASVVGLVCLYIFGFKDPSALLYGEYCGIAFQLTNILRDIKEDAQMGRIYLPQEDLQKFQCSREELLQFKSSPAFIELMKYEYKKAEAYYEKGAPVTSLVEPDSQKALKVMISIYHGVLQKIRRKGYDTLSRRIHLTLLEKLQIIRKAL